MTRTPKLALWRRRCCVKKLLLVGAMLVGACCAAAAQTAKVDRIQIDGAGITEVASEKRVQDRDAASGHRIETKGVRLKEATTRIPAIFGTRFGMIYSVVGHPRDAIVSFKRVTIFPQVGLLNPSTGQRTYRQEAMFQDRIGVQSYRGYYLNNEWEVVPGEWVIQVWDGNRMLAEQKFTLYLP